MQFMAKTDEADIQKAVTEALDRLGADKCLLITAGPTCEDIDAVRFITNRSSGKMGIAVAQAAQNDALPVLLVLGPTTLSPPDGCETIRVRSADDMHEVVMAALPRTVALIMTAAVADYTPVTSSDAKLKKTDGELLLRLKRTPDILTAVAESPFRHNLTVIGFSLDVEMNLAEGRRKLTEKQLDAIVVNTSSSFGNDTINACILKKDGLEQDLGTTSKVVLAKEIISFVTSASDSSGE